MVLTEVQLQAIIGLSFIGIALVLALYTIIIQTLDELIKKRIKNLKKATSERDKIFDELGHDKDNIELKKQYDLLHEEVENLKNIPYYQNWGYVISAIFFALALFFSFTPQYFGREILGFFNGLVEYSPHFLFIGILNFFYICFQTMSDLRNYTLGKFDEYQAIESKKEIEFKKLLERINLNITKKGK